MSKTKRYVQVVQMYLTDCDLKINKTINNQVKHPLPVMYFYVVLCFVYVVLFYVCLPYVLLLYVLHQTCPSCA